jgi:hypothetical protein
MSEHRGSIVKSEMSHRIGKEGRKASDDDDISLPSQDQRT